MDVARKIASDGELRTISDTGRGFIIDPFNRRLHTAGCPHVRKMTTGEPKWFALTRAAVAEFLQQRLAQYPTAKLILTCKTCRASESTMSSDAQS
jgi:hypothetical protein